LYTSPPDYVRTHDELLAAIARLSTSSFVALDTEFLRERTYYAKLCLIQLGTDDYCVLIDVLEPLDLKPLFEFLNNRDLVKVLHAAHQDLEVLAQTQGTLLGTGTTPIAGPIFDTQVAAGYAGISAQIGYGDLVQQRLNVTLEKGHSRTDWSQRPLSPEQISYAADDVRYLVELYHNFKTTMSHMLRWGWIEEDAEQLEDPALYVTQPEDAWKRLKGLEQLTPPQFAAAKALAAWREQRAILKDRPRSWIITDDVLRALAERLPTTAEEVADTHGMPKSVAEKRSGELLELITTASQAAANDPHTPWKRPPRSQVNKVTRLMEFVRAEAARLNVSSELLATRREMEQFVFNGKVGDFGHGWREATFGKRLMKIAEEEST
jgi:ribonuclease D